MQNIAKAIKKYPTQLQQIRCVLLLLLLSTSLSVFAAPSATQVTQELNVLSPYQTQIQAKLEKNKALISYITQELEHYKLPKILVLVPMLESSYNPDAVSHANAAGLWQLIPTTAQRFGLEVDNINDQRFQPTPSTQAAVQYLSFLYNKFGDLALTLAAYNAGEGRVSRAIQKANNRQFTQLTLPAETVQYVSRFYALLELVKIDHLTHTSSHKLFLFGGNISRPLIDVNPLPPLISL